MGKELTMAIRLTESKLRQIIREEAAKLSRRPTRRLSEMARGSSVARQADVMAANYGATHYIDYDLDISPAELGGAGVGDNVAEILADLIPELQGAISGSEDVVVMINPSGPGGGLPVFRFYGDSTAMEMLADAFGEMEGDAPRTDLIKPLRVSSRMMDT
jgi:DNA topoisomerase VI subunit B